MRVDSSMNTAIDNTSRVKNHINDERVVIPENMQTKANPDNSRASKYSKDEMPLSEKTIIDAIEKANRAITGPNKRFEFSIHKATREIMVKVFDNDTGEVLREFPPEKILDMVAKMWEMAGIIVDERR